MEPEKMKTISFSTWSVSPLAEVLQPQQKPCGQKCNQLHKERVVDDLNVFIMTMINLTFLALLETTSREGRLILYLKQARGFHLHILSVSLGPAHVSYQSLMITTLVSMQLNAILQYYAWWIIKFSLRPNNSGISVAQNRTSQCNQNRWRYRWRPRLW